MKKTDWKPVSWTEPTWFGQASSVRFLTNGSIKARERESDLALTEPSHDSVQFSSIF